MKNLNRRDFIRYASISVGAGAAGGALGAGCGLGETIGREEKGRQKRPNVLWIMMDDCRADAVGCYGRDWPKTPNMDEIAAMGVRFDSAIIQSPVCVPSRSSMKTSQYPHTLGIMAMGKPPVVEPAYARTANRDAPNLLKVWKDNGFKLVSVGKRHAYARDWDHRGDVTAHVGYLGGPKSEELKRRIEESGSKYPAAVTRTHKWAIGGVVPLKPEEMSISELGDLGAATLEELAESEEPFFLRVSFHAPHVPCRICKEYFIDPVTIDLPLPSAEEIASKPEFERENIQIYSGADLTDEQIGIARGTYYGMVSLVDAQVGKLLKVLKDSARLDNTIVVINSDQGFQLGEHGFWKKRCFYEQNVKVPFIISCPNHLPKGRVVDEPVEMVDFLPTLMDLTGLEVPAPLAGRSLKPLIEGKVKKWRKACFAEHDYSGDMYDELRRDGGRCVMVRTKEWKLIYYKDQRMADRDGKLFNSLYNLKDDPGETKNLYGRPGREEITKELKNLADEWDNAK